MQLVYVDESGDPGGPTPAALAQGTSRHFILSSVAIDEGDWDQSLRTLVDIRTRLLARHGGNISAAAREADMDRKYLHRLALEHGVHPGPRARR